MRLISLSFPSPFSARRFLVDELRFWWKAHPVRADHGCVNAFTLTVAFRYGVLQTTYLTDLFF